jgi:CubicO group peptidase (beta-lactamase class C family)
MMLAEEGKLRLNDPVERHLPEFRGQMMIDQKTSTTQTIKKPPRPITIRDLMTHTSGLIANPPPGLGELLGKMDRTLAEAVLVYSQQPLEFEPGSRWMYSNPGIATLGRIVEVAADMPFEKFLETRVFEPLGMKDSHIFLPAEKQARLAPVYSQKDGWLVRVTEGLLAGDPLGFRKGARYSGPEYAMYSTAEDLAQFYQMMLNRGTLGGKRLLSPASVEVMSTVHTGELRAGHDPGVGFGLTWAVTKDPIGILSGHGIGTFGHGGAFGTYGWIDPRRDMVGVFLIQFSGDRRDVRDAFVEMATAAIID